MAEHAVHAPPDPGVRGGLTVEDKAVRRIAERAALGTPGVRRHSRGLRTLTGRDLPRVRVLVAQDRVRAQVDIAARWASSLPHVTAAVRDSVADALVEMAGLTVDTVDVSITRTAASAQAGDAADGDVDARADAEWPPAGRTPVAAPAAGFCGTLVALCLAGAGVVALRDAICAAGWIGGSLWTTAAVRWIDGLTFTAWMVPAGIGCVVVGLWLVYCALKPRRKVGIALDARSQVWLATRDIARLAAAAAQSVPGVLEARASASRSTVTVAVDERSGAGDSSGRQDVAEAVRAALEPLRPAPKVRVQTRRRASS